MPSALIEALSRGEAFLGCITEFSAAVLVLLEFGVLLAGVTSRYLFRQPLVWADELAGALFLWLAMLGAIIAMRRDEHMRLTLLVRLLPPFWGRRLEALSAATVTVFMGLLVLPAHNYVVNEHDVMMPALEISNSYRVAAIEVGIAVMFVRAMIQLPHWCSARRFCWITASMVMVTAAILFARPALSDFGNWNLLLFFVVLAGLCIAVGVPIAIAFGVATVAYLSLLTDAPLTVVVSRMDEGMSHLILLSVPLFIFLGLLIEATGMARALVDFLASLVGHVRGGLSYVLLGAMFLVSGISGAKAADMAAVAPVLFPEMKRRGWQPGELIALLSASGAMSETIPPSLVLITIGSVTGVSIAALFAAGVLPALVLALTLCVMTYLRREKAELACSRRPGFAQIGRAFATALPALALPFLIRAAVAEGVATATEVSTIGITYSVVAGVLIYRQLDWRRLFPMLVRTAALSGAILFVIGTATAMAWALAQSGFSRQLASIMASMPGGPAGFMAISIVVFVVLGSLLEGIPAIVLLGPLLFPAARAIGIHDVHYAVVVILAMGLGLFAPPVGIGYYAACTIGDVSPDEGMRRVWPYLGALLIGLLIVAAFPWISTGSLKP